MYCGNVTRVLIFSQRNPSYIQSRGKHFLNKERAFGSKFQTNFFRFCSLFVSNITSPVKYNDLTKGLKFFYAQNILMRYLKHEISKIPLCLKKHSVHIVRMCTQQCECVVAHRIRRGQQMFSLYTKLWDEVALKELVCRMRQQLSRRGKEILLSAVGVSAYNWEKKIISDEEILSYMDELEHVYMLRDSTVTCPNCRMRQIVDMEIPSVMYCQCPGSAPVSSKVQDVKWEGNDRLQKEEARCNMDTVMNAEHRRLIINAEWLPFIERQDLLVWRKEEDNRGLYAYKVYGKYDDVTAEDFLRVQIDTDYRKEWDTTAVQLQVLESDPTSNSDVIYWEMLWPRMFSNRDYVFNRRYKVDKEKNLMLVVNKGTEHPKCPERKENHRVTEYWSYMVIKPQYSFTEPGIEFSLTYFDNPGVSIPTTIASWVAMSGLPDFLGRVREAARELACRRKSMEEPNIKPLAGLSPDMESKPISGLPHQEPQSEPTSDISQEPVPDVGQKPEAELTPDVSQKPESELLLDISKKPEPESTPDIRQEADSDTPSDTHQEPAGDSDQEPDAEADQEQPKSSPNASPFPYPYQDPQDLSYLQFHATHLFI